MVSNTTKSLAHLAEDRPHHRAVSPTMILEQYLHGTLPPDPVLPLEAPGSFAVVETPHNARRTSTDGRRRPATLAVFEELATTERCPPRNEQNLQGLKVDKSKEFTQAGGQTTGNIFFQNAINHTAKSWPVFGRSAVRHRQTKIFVFDKDLSRYLCICYKLTNKEGEHFNPLYKLSFLLLLDCIQSRWH